MAAVEVEVDVELLITSAEARPILWDKTLEDYKCKNKTQEAWTEICRILSQDFDTLNNKQRDILRKFIIKKWTNVKDSWMKSYKNYLEAKKSGIPAKQKYKYRNQLSFLKKVFYNRQLHGQTNTYDLADEFWEDQKPIAFPKRPSLQLDDQENFLIESSSTSKRKSDGVDTIRLRKSADKPPGSPPNHHMSFFSGILPSLNSFNDEQVLEFQIGVLNLIKTIKNSTF